jgi:hypothetical protein
MTETAQGHLITLSLAQAPPAEIAAGIDTVLKVRAECSAGCDLRGNVGKIVTENDEVIKEFYLTQFYGINETDALILKAPIVSGEHTWTVVLPEQEKNDVTHAEVSTSCTFMVKDYHKTNMAVWDVDSPVLKGSPFSMKVGIRCSVDCQLTDREIEIYDHQDILLTTGRLGENPWQDSEALYWTEIELQAPDDDGIFTWAAKFSEPDSESPHLESSMSFGFEVVEPPNCSLKVEVTDQETGLPINDVDVVLHPYRAKTGEDGIVDFELTEGEYQLYAVQREYDIYRAVIKASGNMTITAALVPSPALPYDQG